MSANHRRRLCRSSHDSKLAGVCGGFAEYFHLDSSLVRLLTMVATIFVWPLFLVYIAAAFVIPRDDDPIADL